MLSKLRQFPTHRININFYLRGELKWEGTLKLLMCSAIYLVKCQETNNNKINLENCLCIRKFLTYFVVEDAKCYCAVLSIPLYVCLDKVRLWGVGGKVGVFFFFLLKLCHLLLAVSLWWSEIHLEKLFSVDLHAYACTEGNACKWGSICTDYSN